MQLFDVTYFRANGQQTRDLDSNVPWAAVRQPSVHGSWKRAESISGEKAIAWVDPQGNVISAPPFPFGVGQRAK